MEVASREPLLYCPRCYGFWAVGDALAHGVADPQDEHPALRAAMAPALCRKCMGHLRETGECVRCGWTRPALACPACAAPMSRTKMGAVYVDTCGVCRGVWYDVGELCRVYDIPEPLSLVARVMGTTEPGPTDGELFVQALWALSRLIFPFI
ncbi:MAG: zf-TFIIB domain-containing protein [Chloroflexi bacterium]|nr:zf-TFIIB domain-containing protein [Chloroflexota bacterium]